MTKGVRDALLEKLKKSDLEIEDKKVLKIAEEIEIAMFGKESEHLDCILHLPFNSRNIWRSRAKIQEQIQEFNLQHQGQEKRRSFQENPFEGSPAY